MVPIANIPVGVFDEVMKDTYLGCGSILGWRWWGMLLRCIFMVDGTLRTCITKFVPCSSRCDDL